MLLLYIIIVLNVKKGWDKCPKKESHFTSLSNKRNDLIHEARRNIYQWQRLFDGLLMPIWLGMTRRTTPVPKPLKKVGPFIPRINDGGFLGRQL